MHFLFSGTYKVLIRWFSSFKDQSQRKRLNVIKTLSKRRPTKMKSPPDHFRLLVIYLWLWDCIFIDLWKSFLFLTNLHSVEVPVKGISMCFSCRVWSQTVRLSCCYCCCSPHLTWCCLFTLYVCSVTLINIMRANLEKFYKRDLKWRKVTKRIFDPVVTLLSVQSFSCTNTNCINTISK